MSASLDLAQASRILRGALKDRSYRATPLGLEVARFIRWKRGEWGATPKTIRDYEAILAKMALYFADLELADMAPPVGTERLRECLDHYWGDRSPRTRAKARSVFLSFFDWAEDERGLYGNPAKRIRSPRQRDTAIETFTPSFVEKVIAGQTYLPDELGCWLILKYGLRKSGAATAQIKNFDAERELLTVYTKVGRIHPLPIPEPAFWLKLQLAVLEHQLGPDDYLIPRRRDTREVRCPVADSERTLDVPGMGPIGYRTRVTRWHDREPTDKLMHHWWYQCLETAGVVEKGTTAGKNMHRGRHTAITEVLRASHDLKLAQMLAGHKEIASTSRYAQLDTNDLASVLRDMFGVEDG